jgi:tetratricopeptide (TPR) repeat protein
LEEAIRADGRHLNARFQLALLHRENGDGEKAREQLGCIEELDPTSRLVVAERYFLTGKKAHAEELLRLLGGQSQEALEVSWNYGRIGRWKQAAGILQMVEEENSDPWGTPPVFYYTLAYFLDKLEDLDASSGALQRARDSGDNVDRFPFREETEKPLREAIARDPSDTVSRFNLACLLYHFGRTTEALGQWKKAVDADPKDFGSLRALGLAYAELGYESELASEQLERAILVDPTHVRTFNDLSTIYAKAGRFDRQVDLLKRALERSPGDDNLIEGLIAASLVMGEYDQAEELIRTHQFQPRHRTYHLRDKYRFLRYGQGALAYNSRDYRKALEQFRAALTPPVSLGMDDFQFETTPRVSYYIGRTLESLGQKQEALQAFERSLFGLEHLSGDRDSWNSENFHMVLSLERLGRGKEAGELAVQFEVFAKSQLEGRHLHHRSEARYLLALVKKYQGRAEEAEKLMKEALQIQPDLLGPRYELRGDSLDPISSDKVGG